MTESSHSPATSPVEEKSTGSTPYPPCTTPAFALCCNWGRGFGAMQRRTWVRALAGLAVCIFVTAHAVEAEAETACIQPGQLAHAGVRISRYFSDAERAAQDDGTLGIQGSGWFLTPTAIVTVAHVAVAMNLSTRDWKQLEI